MSFELFFDVDAAKNAGATPVWEPVFEDDEIIGKKIRYWDLGEVRVFGSASFISMQGSLAKSFGYVEETTQQDLDRLALAAREDGCPQFAAFVERLSPADVFADW